MRQGGKQCENYHLLALLLILAVGALLALAITWGQRDTDNKYPNVGAFMVYDTRYDELNQGKHKAKFTVVGSGATLYWPPPDIDYEDKRQFAVSEYRALLKAWLRMSQNHATDDGGTCYGDSGGPAFRTEPDGTEILVGITSWGDMPCVATGCNYRVDIPETLDFLDGVINSLK